TSVVGGVSPLRGRHAAVVSLDMRGLGELIALDDTSATATVGAGMRAPALERALAPHGLTLGHFPQSYEYVSLGGCAATRSAGQASTGYGAIEKMVLGLRLAAPAGEIALPALPATAAARSYEGMFFRDFETGCEALRALARAHALPDVARLSDRAETEVSLALAGDGGVKGRVGRAYIGARGYADGCIAILGFEGDRHEVPARRRRAMRLLRRAGGLGLGSSP